MDRATRRLLTSNLIFGPAGACLTVHLTQILLTCVMCGAFASSFATFWWPAFDSARVLVSVIARMDYLLREQLPGQEAAVARDRTTLLISNVVGVLFAPIVLAYAPFTSSLKSHLEMAILALVILLSHFVSTTPAIYQLLKGLTLDVEPEEANRPLLDSHSRADSYDSASNSPSIGPPLQGDQGDVPPPVNPEPGPSAEAIQQAILNQISKPSGQANSDRKIREEQDSQYEAMLREEKARQACQDQEIEVEMQASPPREVLKQDRQLTPPPTLPPEPSLDEDYIELRVKMLDGSVLKRRWTAETELGVVLSWAQHEAGEKDLQMATRLPRKVFTDFSKTLKDLKFKPGNVPLLFVER